MRAEREILLPQQMQWVVNDFLKQKPAVAATIVAKQANITYTTLSRIRDGQVKPYVSTCLKLVEVLEQYGYDVEYQIYGDVE